MVAENQTSLIESLPIEIFTGVLSNLPTVSLPSLASVSRYFNQAALSLLRLRLLHVTALSNRELILECYHPSAKLSTPYLECPATGNAQDELAGATNIIELGAHYSRFLPTVKEEDKRPRRRYRRTSRTVNAPAINNSTEEESATVDVTLDSCELFTQLCTITNVVTLGPRRGIFTGHVNVGDGVVRVWRDWLAARAGKECTHVEEEDVLWADARRDVGIRFRVVEKQDNNNHFMEPIFLARDEDPVVSYTLVFEELLVRTSALLLSVEKSEKEEVQSSGKAIVIASLLTE